MTETTLSKGTGGTGIIPDFFHDIIAYIIPGCIAIITVIINNIIIAKQEIDFFEKDNLTTILLLFLIAYVLGRFFEQLGRMTIHNRKFLFFGKKRKINSPKWTLLFPDAKNADDKNADAKDADDDYTEIFKEKLRSNIGEWCEDTLGLGKEFMGECGEKGKEKDDYFNLIQYYLREKYPAVALYEKKQNATIVLTRSLTVIFFMNIILFYPIQTLLLINFQNIEFSGLGLIWVLSSLLLGYVFHSRFKLDQKYHAMYIFENFMGLKKLERD